MKPFLSLSAPWVLLGAVLLAVSPCRGSDDEVVVNATTFNGYARQKLPDGSVKAERYGFAEGGGWDRGKSAKTVDSLTFEKVVAAVVNPLKAQNYVPSDDPNQTDLLIVVFWGTTLGAADQANGDPMEGLDRAVQGAGADSTPQVSQGEFAQALMMQGADDQMRQMTDAANARILGFVDAYNHSLYLRDTGFPDTRDTVHELEASRYFVVLKAYDFGVFRKDKKLKPLWEARFSIYEKDKVFADAVSLMAERASRFFGVNTHGLAREEPPEGSVKVGPAKVVEPPKP